MKIITHPLKRPKELKKADRDKIEQVLRDNINLLTKEDKRIYKKVINVE